MEDTVHRQPESIRAVKLMNVANHIFENFDVCIMTSCFRGLVIECHCISDRPMAVGVLRSEVE